MWVLVRSTPYAVLAVAVTRSGSILAKGASTYSPGRLPRCCRPLPVSPTRVPAKTSGAAAPVPPIIQPRARTGLEGLDEVLGGGLPRNHIYLLDGEPGTGKT
ncbi:MAG: ATPase domain-containing protein, partial [Hyalangium sp.]|uniref:ATPase domain-containing protein n=1 Tax=Hyalangium sp. TaxID=2028555 RepID=UPI003899DB38